MSCDRCASYELKVLNGEVAMHWPGLEGLKKPIVWVFPEVIVCLDCGFAVFAVPDEQREQLRNDNSSAQWRRSAGAS